MTDIIAVAPRKGGVGKTTLSVSLAAELARRGRGAPDQTAPLLSTHVPLDLPVNGHTISRVGALRQAGFAGCLHLLGIPAVGRWPASHPQQRRPPDTTTTPLDNNKSYS